MVDEITASQSDEASRLRMALGWFLADERFQVAVGGNPIAVDEMLNAARAIYQESSNVA